jgi:type IV pilus assembly protein PilC
MPNFSFKGRNRQGEAVSGERVADNRQALALALRREQIFLLDAEEKKAGSWKNIEFGGAPTPKDVAVFTRQFSVMIDAGVPLVQCLQILGDQQENKKFKAAIQGVTKEVESGSNLAGAMKMHPTIFDDLYTNMVAAGEAGGILDTIFQRLSVYIEKAVKLKRAVQSALVYPIAVVLIAGGVITLILWKVVPQFTILFESMGVDLPLPTRIVITSSKFIGGIGGLLTGIGIGISLFVLRSYYGTPKGRYNVDKLLLKAPIFGPLMRKIAVARFTRTMATLIASGVPILDCLEITAHTSGNAVIEEAILNVKSAIEQGRTIVDPLKESGVFPSMVTQMIGVGEQAGALETMLTKIADFYEEEVDSAVGDLMTAMEPLMIVVLGTVVGGIVISMYLPIFTLVGQLSSGKK